VSASAAVGMFPITVLATRGSLSHSTQLHVRVPASVHEEVAKETFDKGNFHQWDFRAGADRPASPQEH
jgi:hypothetical protein